MPFLQNGLSVTLIITTTLLACASAIAKPLPSKDGCRPVSMIEYDALVCTSEQDRSVDGIIGTVRCRPERAKMREWLVADLSLMDFTSSPATDGAERLSGIVCECPHGGAPC